jgi:tetratricopeptide (TPR) repeat protein
MMQRFVAIILCLLVPGTALAAASVPQMQQLITQKRFVDAASTGEQLLGQNPRHSQARFLTAYAYQMSAQTDQAIRLYQSLIKDNPQLPEPRNNLAMIYLAQGDYDRASQLLVEALNTHSSYAIAYDNLSQVYKGIASEAYRRAVSESSEPSKYTHNIELTAITDLETAPAQLPETEIAAAPTLVNFANQETLLIESVKSWAQAWSDKDFAGYTGFYTPRYRAKFESHQQWVEQRRKRITRPGTISVEVSDIQIKWRSENRAIIDFKQAFDSPRYSDRVMKRLGFSLTGSQWKIIEERVLSVL